MISKVRIKMIDYSKMTDEELLAQNQIFMETKENIRYEQRKIADVLDYRSLQVKTKKIFTIYNVGGIESKENIGNI